MYFRYLFSTVLLLACTSAAQDKARSWKEFKSNTGFSVAYPAAWHRIGVSEDRLEILSSPGGAEAVVIKRGQGEIIVVELHGAPDTTLSELIDQDTRSDVSILARGEIHNERAQKGACSDLKRVVSEEEPVPSKDVPIRVPYVINTAFYCEINGRRFRTLLRNWQGEKRQEEYQRIAQHVAQSLQLTP